MSKRVSLLRRSLSSATTVCGICVPALCVTGCVCVDVFHFFALHGRLLDLASGTPLAAVSYTANFYKNGQQISGYTDEDAILAEESDGEFSLAIYQGGSGGCGPIGFLDNLIHPPQRTIIPDQVELIVRRDQCEVRVLIDLDEETVSDYATIGRQADLINPVLVPGCP